MKYVFKKLTPNLLMKFYSKFIVRRRNLRLQSLNDESAFDLVYKEKMWQQGKSLSGVGSEDLKAQESLNYIQFFIREKDISSILDVGCGDFFFGSNLIESVQYYKGVDVSSFIIELNKKKYRYPNVDFEVCNIKKSIPEGDFDLVVVREVFQHLDNQSINSSINNLEKIRSKYILVIESCYKGSEFISNIDLQGNSISTRVSLKSGVVLSDPPFKRSFHKAHEKIMFQSHDGGESLVFYLYEQNR